MITSVVVGNPKPGSRTLGAATALAEYLTGKQPDNVIDVVTLGAGLLGWGDPDVAAAKATVQGSDLVIFASPTFKASYTGLLKLFLDQFETATGLGGVVAVPLMLGAAPAHHMTAEYLLKPVLVELGATVPAQGLYLIDATAAEQASSADWIAQWGATIVNAVESSEGEKAA